MMRLLFITPTPPDRPDRDGMTQIAYELIQQLGPTNDIEVWTLAKPGAPDHMTVPGATQVWPFVSTDTSLIRHYLGRRPLPFFQARYESLSLHAALRRLQPGDFDLVVFHTSFVAQYLRDTRLPAVVHVIDALSDWFPKAAASEPNMMKRYHLQLEGRQAEVMEKTMLARARALTVVSEADATTIRHAAPNTPVITIPIGIDTKAFFPPQTPRAPATIIMTGIMNYAPNVDAAEYFVTDIWPAVHGQHPEAVFHLVGRSPDPRVLALQKVPGVTVTGRVASMADELRQATMSVSPLRFGTGYKIKINEALACGTPLVASAVSLVGTGVRPDQECLVANNPAEWAHAIDRILTDRTLAANLSRRAVQFAAQRSWPTIAEQYRNVYLHAIAHQ